MYLYKKGKNRYDRSFKCNLWKLKIKCIKYTYNLINLKYICMFKTQTLMKQAHKYLEKNKSRHQNLIKKFWKKKEKKLSFTFFNLTFNMILNNGKAVIVCKICTILIR